MSTDSIGHFDFAATIKIKGIEVDTGTPGQPGLKIGAGGLSANDQSLVLSVNGSAALTLTDSTVRLPGTLEAQDVVINGARLSTAVFPWKLIKSDYTAKKGERLAVKPSQNLVVYLPPNPREGETVEIADCRTVIDGSTLFVGCNGLPVQGTVEDVEIDVPGTHAIFMWSGEPQGWLVFTPSSAKPATDNTVTLTTGTVPVRIDSTTTRTARYTVHMVNGEQAHSTEINLLHGGTTALLSEYGTLMTTTLATFSAEVTQTNLELWLTPTLSGTSVRVFRVA
jgi:hypothetical protein